MTENEISFKIRKCIFKTYNDLGPGLLESVYENVLAYELVKCGLTVQQQVPVPVFHEAMKLNVGFRIDLLVEQKVIVEIKSIEALAPVHFKQLITYLKMSDKKLGILVNFSVDNIAGSIFRKVNGL